MEYQLVTIVLAAGESRRMGQPKLFLPLFGSTLLRLAVRAALDLEPEARVVVVTGAYDTEIREHLTSFDTVLCSHNRRWKEGMTTSISLGITVGAMFLPTHYLITLADQPTMGAESLALLAEESLRYPDQIVATQYPERLGVPAIFPFRYVKDLRQLSGNFGARQLIDQAHENVRAITFEVPPPDVDTPEDYAKLLEEDKTNS